MTMPPMPSLDGERAPRFGLRARLVGLVLTILVVLLVAIAAVVVWRATDALDEVDRSRMRAATALVAESLATGVLAESEAMLSAPLAAFAKTPELLEVVVLDDHGEIVTSRRAALPSEHEAQVTVRVPIVARAAPVDDELAAFGIESTGEREVGVVVATFARRSTARIEDGMRRDFVVLFLAFGGLGLLFILLAADGVVRRVRTLGAAARRLSSGALDVRVHDTSDDELGLLARDFDRMADALGEQRRALEDASVALADKESLAAIGRATAVIAHELKNPLGIVLGAAEIVQSDARSAEQRARAAGIIVDEVKRLDGTLRGLLQGARPRTLTLARVHPRALVDGVRARVEVASESTSIAFASNVGEDVPDVRVDVALTEEVLLNLVWNAREAGARTVTVSARVEARAVRLVVDDDGPGVDARVRSRLFAPFVTNKARGTGLGLSSSRRTARDQGGELEVDGAHAPGARFVLTLARAQSDDEKGIP